MEADAWLNLGLLHLVGIREGEGAEHIDTLALDVDMSIGNGTVTVNFGSDIAYCQLLVSCLRNVGIYVSDGQFTA